MVAIPGKNWRERNVFNLFYCMCLKLVCITELPLRCDSYYMLQIKDVSGIVSNWHAIPCKKCEDLTAPIYPISQWYMIPLGNKIACLYYTSWVTPSNFQAGTTHEALLLQLKLVIPQLFCVHVSENKDMHNSRNVSLTRENCSSLICHELQLEPSTHTPRVVTRWFWCNVEWHAGT